MVVAPTTMLLQSPLPFIGALQFRALAVVCVNISLNLYILDYIRRKDFVTAEPKRLAFMGVAWFIGPALGIWLYKTHGLLRSEEHTSELQSLMRISYAVFCLKKKHTMQKSNDTITV